MNFNFINTQRKFGVQPNMRQFSTLGVFPQKIDSLLSKTGQINVFNSPIISNKSFTNPNYVNKHHPNILSSTLAGIVNFNKNICVQPKCDIKEDKTSDSVIPDKSSQEKVVNIPQEQIKSPKMTKRNKRKKNRTKRKLDKKCKNNKSRPWHKTNMDYEIMELSELDSDSSNRMEETPICITITSNKPNFCIQTSKNLPDKCPMIKSSPIDINPRLQLEKSDSSMSISPCHHEILKSLSLTSLSKSDSPCSPVIRRLRMPSECESEDSFVVFEDLSICDEVSSYEDSDFEEESEMSYESDSEVEFSENCDSGAQKKVSFKNDSELCTVHPMITWGYAYHTARVGPWEEYARDRARFEQRIKNNEDMLTKILDPEHRAKVYNDRFKENC